MINIITFYVFISFYYIIILNLNFLLKQVPYVVPNVIFFLCDLSRSTVLLELEMDGNTEPLKFAPGDHVGIFPGNSPELVAGILKHLPNAPPINQSLHLEFLSDSYPGTEPSNLIT